MAISLNSIVGRADDTVEAELPEGETAVMKVALGNYYVLNQIGSQIWKTIERPVPVATICDLLVMRYDVERDECLEQTLSYLAALLAEQLVVVHETSA